MAKKASMMTKVGGWSFIVGVVIALLIGLFSGLESTTAVSVLVVLGLIVGFLNVTEKETTGFLLATVALVLVSGFGGSAIGQVTTIGPYMSGVLQALMIFVIPATIIVALKAIYNIAQDA